MVITIVLSWAAPVAAHDGVQLTIHSDGTGSVWVTAKWADGHPVTERAGALLTASSTTGTHVGPAALKQVGDVLSYPGSLAPGEWTVVAEMGQPAIARCQAVVRVAAAGTAPSSTDVPCPVATGPPRAASPPRESGSTLWYVLAGVLVTALAGGIFLYGRARVARSTAAARRRPGRKRS